MENISSLFQGSSLSEYQRPDPKSDREAVAAAGEQPWEMIMDKKHFKLWRRPIEGTHLYQYRGNGAPRTPPGGCFSSAWLVFIGNWGGGKPRELSFAALFADPIPPSPLGGVPALPPALENAFSFEFCCTEVKVGSRPGLKYFLFTAVFGSYTDVTPRQFFNVQVSAFDIGAVRRVRNTSTASASGAGRRKGEYSLLFIPFM